MRKQIVLMVVAMVVFAMGCCGCGLQSGNNEKVANDVGTGAEAMLTECASETDALDMNAGLGNEADVAEAASAEATTQEAVTDEGIEVDLSTSSEVENTEQKEPTDATEQSGERETSEGATEVATTEATSEPVVEEPSDSSTEQATEESTETSTEQSTEQTPEVSPENSFVAYDPNYVVALATEKTKAYGKIRVWENLDRLLAEGQITQEEYNEYYPYDGLEDSYYSVFVKTDLSKASTISGELLGTEEGIAEYIAGMLALETGPYFAISYAGIYEGASGDFYEFRCHR